MTEEVVAMEHLATRKGIAVGVALLVAAGAGFGISEAVHGSQNSTTVSASAVAVATPSDSTGSSPLSPQDTADGMAWWNENGAPIEGMDGIVVTYIDASPVFGGSGNPDSLQSACDGIDQQFGVLPQSSGLSDQQAADYRDWIGVMGTLSDDCRSGDVDGASGQAAQSHTLYKALLQDLGEPLPQ